MQLSQTAFILYILIFLLLGGAIGAWITRMLLRYPFGRNPLTGKYSYVGKKAVVVSKKAGILRVAINSQVWNAICSDMETVMVGDIVMVTDMENLTLTVKKEMPSKNSVQDSPVTNGPVS